MLVCKVLSCNHLQLKYLARFSPEFLVTLLVRILQWTFVALFCDFRNNIVATFCVHRYHRAAICASLQALTHHEFGDFGCLGYVSQLWAWMQPT
jgi:hypothetical protein